MKLQNIGKALQSFGGKAKFRLLKSSPEILVVSGVIGGVVSAVLACKATTKLQDILQNGEDELNMIEKCAADEAFAQKHDYSPEDAKKDRRIVYVQTGLKVAKLYAPSVLMGAASIAGILGGCGILRKRNAALGAACATITQSFKDYRSGVKERFGEQVDKELRHHLKAGQVEKTWTDEATGEEKKIEETVHFTENDGLSDYARFFDESSREWEKNAELNLLRLRALQATANNKLYADGYLFLNDVYDMLDIPRTKAGQVVGWVYDPKNPKLANYVDFGMYDVLRSGARDFVNGYERTILLDFNVDGPILDYVFGKDEK